MTYLARAVQKSLSGASCADSNLRMTRAEVVPGMIGDKIRYFLNNLCSMEDARYLEVGSYKGASLAAAVSGNVNLKAVAIDNFSEFKERGGKEGFYTTLNEILAPQRDQIRFFEKSCWDVVLQEKFNIFFYDGAHDRVSQGKALEHFYPMLDDEFVYIVDDWNYSEVSLGTWDGIFKMKAEVVSLYEIYQVLDAFSLFNPRHWWNGLFVAVLKKGEGL